MTFFFFIWLPGVLGRIFSSARHWQVQAKKTSIRKKILQYLKTQKEEDRLRKSLTIQEQLFAAPEFNSAKTILFYASFDGEVETFEMMRRAQHLGKRIALPFILKEEKRIVPLCVDNLNEDLEIGPYHIKQPRWDQTAVLREQDLDLLVVPGVAFDQACRRLGRGAGYYDRFLSQVPKTTPSVGLAFDFQMVERLPHQEHDIMLSRVIVA